MKAVKPLIEDVICVFFFFTARFLKPCNLVEKDQTAEEFKSFQTHWPQTISNSVMFLIIIIVSLDHNVAK